MELRDSGLGKRRGKRLRQIKSDFMQFTFYNVMIC